MPITFPSNPTVNQTFTAGGKTWTWSGKRWRASSTTSFTAANIGIYDEGTLITNTPVGINFVGNGVTVANIAGTITVNVAASLGGGGASVTVSGTAPASPSEGNLWMNSETGDLYVYAGGGWVLVGGGGGGSGGVAAVYDTASTSTGYFALPKGTTAQRPGSGANGYIRFNTTVGTTEHYTLNGWESIGGVISVATVSPSSFTGNAGTQFTITGSGFVSGCVVSFITSSGQEYAATTTFLTASNLLTTTPRNFTVAEEPLSVKVTNPSGATGTRLNAIDCGGTPSFASAAGSLGNIYDSSRASYTLASAAATDPDGTAITYSITSGSLPAGLSFNTATAAITGTATAVVSDTTYTFTVAASDGINTSTRQFSITVLAPVILTYTTSGTYSWTAPAGLTQLSRVIMIGGGGGGSAGNGAWAGGGGGGGFINVTALGITPGTTYSLVVGVKGLGVTVCGGGPVTSGGNTTAFNNTAFGGGTGGPNTVGGAGGLFTRTAGTDAGCANGNAGNASTGDGSAGGGTNGGGSTYGTGAAGVANGTAGNHASGYGNGGGGGHSCQGGHRGGGDGSAGYIEIRY